MNHPKQYPVSSEFIQHTHINEAKYHAMYQQSLADPDSFLG